MNGPDYQMALLLQRQLQHEESYDSDFHLARVLQDDFNMETSIENPIGLTYHNKKRSENDKRSLIDPSWELIDPTPNIHNLFVAFDQRYFWNKLSVVCVSWSKAMTRCAGICSYQGRGGMCSIKLSEPLLKLRPRKDLVETLLHEMIHAYLFVTHNNRDRDGHGPEFHKHMFRINKEAGTNITVYHDFHDEVRLYQQHWWRCNGPCQNWKPYFGMVRRATNRAPGPNDRWWAEHSLTCGGIYIKVKEPEKNKTLKESKLSPKKGAPTSDIRKFISSTKQSNFNNDIYRLNNINSTQTKVSPVSSIGNIHGFSNLQTPVNIPKQVSNGNIIKNLNDGNGSTRTKSNSNSTIVVKKKSNVSDINNKTIQPTKPELNVFSGKGKALVSHTTNKCDGNDYSVVRNHWLNKFPPVSPQKIKRSKIINEVNESSKKQKIEGGNGQHKMKDMDVIVLNDLSVNCPVCEKQIEEALLNNHLDFCLLEKNKETHKKYTCFVCNKELSQDNYRPHVSSCFENNFDKNDNLVECEICNIMVDENKIESHRKLCIENIFANSSPIEDFSDSCAIVKAKDPGDLTKCSVCDNFVNTDELSSHQEKCLQKFFDELDKKHGLTSNNETVLCLVCDKKIYKSDLSTHLDECMSGVFDEKNDINPPTSGSKVEEEDGHNCGINKKYNCPFCMKLYSELDMSGHLDECLISDDGNKTILIDSFSNDDGEQ